ncbi:MAG: DUF3365 domain-containing protein [Planctomycetaceae bacterium]
MFVRPFRRLTLTLMFIGICWLALQFPTDQGTSLASSPATVESRGTPANPSENIATSDPATASSQQEKAATPNKRDSKKRPAAIRFTQEEARRRAELFHEMIESTLMLMHREYFEEGGDGQRANMIPSKALESVFNRVARRSDIEARWLAVNAQAMSVDHRPQDAFEHQAVRALTQGDQEFVAVENGSFRRATQIALFGSCVKCHAPPPMNPGVRRVAGLLVKIPIITEESGKRSE